MSRKVIIILMALTVLLGFCTCESRYPKGVMNGALYRKEIGNFRDTEAWELAKAVKWQNTGKIKKILKDNPELVNFQDPTHDMTLLMWAIGTEKYKSAKTLLECGADPNIASEAWYGETALLIACGFSWVDTFAKTSPKYVDLLLEYGADPNQCYTSGYKKGESPLMEAIGGGLDKVKSLVEGGADINYVKNNGTGRTAVECSITYALIDDIETVHYLIVEKKADIPAPYFYKISDLSTNPITEVTKVCYPLEDLRDWGMNFELDSPKYQIKLEIINELISRGVDYYAIEIPKNELERIKKQYPDTWEEYIKVC